MAYCCCIFKIWSFCSYKRIASFILSASIFTIYAILSSNCLWASLRTTSTLFFSFSTSLLSLSFSYICLLVPNSASRAFSSVSLTIFWYYSSIFLVCPFNCTSCCLVFSNSSCKSLICLVNAVFSYSPASPHSVSIFTSSLSISLLFSWSRLLFIMRYVLNLCSNCLASLKSSVIL